MTVLGFCLRKLWNIISFGSVPYMGQREVEMILSYITPLHIMLEWGSGASTIYFSRRVNEYYSIEHDRAWYAKLDRHVDRLGLDNIHLFLVPPNESLEGLPNHARSPQERWSQFTDYIDKVAVLGVARFDSVLIDGRSRPECARRVLEFLKPESVVFIHDFFNTRYGKDSYHRAIAEDYEIVDEVRSGQSLVVLRPKASSISSKVVVSSRRL